MIDQEQIKKNCAEYDTDELMQHYIKLEEFKNELQKKKLMC